MLLATSFHYRSIRLSVALFHESVLLAYLTLLSQNSNLNFVVLHVYRYLLFAGVQKATTIKLVS